MPLILLAGGQSRRMGSPKALLEVGGEPLLRLQLRRWRAVGGLRAVVVLGWHREELTRRLPELGESGEGPVDMGHELKTAVSADPARGPFASVQAGIRRALDLWPATEALAILPVDVPLAGADVVAALAGEAAGRQGGATLPVFGAHGGHPVFLGRGLAERLLLVDMADADARLDVQLRKLDAGQVVRVPVSDPAVVTNLNDPGAWVEWIAGRPMA